MSTDELSAALQEIGDLARRTLEEKHQAREVTIGASRKAIQACAASIRATHRGEYERAEQLLGEAHERVHEADAATDAHPEVRSNGPLHDAKKELAEAALTLAFVRGDAIPGPADLRIEVTAFLNGMAEAASELRREVLDCLRHGDLATAERLLGIMDDVYSQLVTIDYPDGVTAGLRRTTDQLRAVLERTRGDLTTTVVAARLQAAIDGELDGRR